MSTRRGVHRALLALGVALLVGVGCGDEAPAGTDGGSGADLVSTASAPDLRQVETACGGATGMSCPMGMFCELAVGACGGNVPGICRAIPATCPSEMNPVCGCDDMTYDNDCLRRKASQSASQAGRCP